MQWPSKKSFHWHDESEPAKEKKQQQEVQEEAQQISADSLRRSASRNPFHSAISPRSMSDLEEALRALGLVQFLPELHELGVRCLSQAEDAMRKREYVRAKERIFACVCVGHYSAKLNLY